MTNNKNNKKEGQLKLAVLIDADNVQPCIIEGLLAEVAKYGVAIVKRMYGDGSFLVTLNRAFVDQPTIGGDRNLIKTRSELTGITYTHALVGGF